MAVKVGSDHWPFGVLQERRYGCILADPPWRFETRSELGRGKCADQHYACMKLADIKRLPVHRLAAPDSCLILWFPQFATPQAVSVMRAWGFAPKTLGAWAKRSPTDSSWAFGTGYRFRSAAEFYLLGTRGAPKQAARDIRNLIVSPVQEHSRKPDEMHRNLERMFPSVPRCELFARRPTPGWDVWGDQLEQS
jgi:N6-adenosine-specific RNA methylase IME4